MKEKIDEDLHGICASCDKPQARRVDALDTRQCAVRRKTIDDVFP